MIGWIVAIAIVGLVAYTIRRGRSAEKEDEPTAPHGLQGSGPENWPFPGARGIVMTSEPGLVETNGWVSFDEPKGAFSISYPSKWQRTSLGHAKAALSCKVGPGFFEVLTLHSNVKRSAETLIRIIADGMAENTPDGRPAKLISREKLFSQEKQNGDVVCERVVISYVEQGVQVIADHFAIGTGEDALHIALKTDAHTYKSERGNFEQVFRTLSTKWHP